LALSTYAKTTEDDKLFEQLFLQSYEKFAKSIETRTDNGHIEICNWSMTLVSHALKKAKSEARKQKRAIIQEFQQKHPGIKEISSLPAVAEIAMALLQTAPCKKLIKEGMKICNWSKFVKPSRS